MLTIILVSLVSLIIGILIGIIIELRISSKEFQDLNKHISEVVTMANQIVEKYGEDDENNTACIQEKSMN